MRREPEAKIREIVQTYSATARNEEFGCQVKFSFQCDIFIMPRCHACNTRFSEPFHGLGLDEHWLEFLNHMGKDVKFWLRVQRVFSPAYCFYNMLTQSHFYTISENDKAIVLQNWPQFQFEGVVWFARTTAGSGSIPMYRFYRPATGTHFFTVSEVDKSIVINTMSAHFNYEGEAYQAWGL